LEGDGDSSLPHFEYLHIPTPQRRTIETMPRPKVHPSQRQRAAEACNFCRASKKRCSATVPCTACKKRGIEASCYLTHKPWGTRRTRENLHARAHNGSNPATAPSVTTTSTDSGSSSTRQNLLPDDSEPGHQQQRHASLPPEATPLWSPASSRNEAGDDYRPLSPSESRVDSPGEVQSNATSSSRKLSFGHDPHARMLLNLRGNRGMQVFD
jgi:hypothetical protein